MRISLCLRPAVSVHFFSGVTSSGEGALFQDRDQGHDFQVIVLTPRSCRELIFSTCSYESDFYVLFDGNTGSVCLCVYLLEVSLCALERVLVCSMLDKCEETGT